MTTRRTLLVLSCAALAIGAARPQLRSDAPRKALPCDVLLTVHPAFAGLDEKLHRREQEPGRNPFVDPGACRAYAADAAQRLARRVTEERGEAAPVRPK